MTVPKCPSDNTVVVDQSSFWSVGGVTWDAHRIGWAIAGGCAAITVIISLITVLKHCRNYNRPNEQRQVLRVLYMPPVYAVISFFSYRYFRSYTYYSLAEAAYEGVTLSAFLLLLIEFVADSAAGHSAEKAIERKGKRKLPIPFCCWRYRPTKPYFMHTVKWAVLQYVIIRPGCSIAGIICEAYNILCSSDSWNIHYADVYLEFVDFISISIALYGLLLFYGLTKDELQGRRPLAKFLSIKLIVMFTFYQSFVFSGLEGRVIHATEYWTATNIADGLNALVTCIEMVIFSILMMWAYTWKEYTIAGAPRTSIWRPLWDSINYTDFLVEIYGSFKYFFTFRGQPSTQSNNRRSRSVFLTNYKSMHFDQAFGVQPSKRYPVTAAVTPSDPSDERIRLAPYPLDDSRSADSTDRIKQ